MKRRYNPTTCPDGYESPGSTAKPSAFPSLVFNSFESYHPDDRRFFIVTFPSFLYGISAAKAYTREQKTRPTLDHTENRSCLCLFLQLFKCLTEGLNRLIDVLFCMGSR